MPVIPTPKLGLRQQIMVLAILPFLLVVSATGLFMLYSYHVETHALDEQHVKRTARLIANSARTALLDGRIASLQSLLDTSLDREILGVAILAPDLKPRITSGDFKPTVFNSDSIVWEKSHVSARWPIYRYTNTAVPAERGTTDALIGWVAVTAAHTKILKTRYLTIAWGVLWAMLSILLTIYLGGRINRILLSRILQLRDILSTLDNHQWNTRLPDSKFPDWTLLSETINSLAQRTQQSFRKLQNEVEHSHRDLQRTLEHLEISNMELELARVEALSASQSKSEFLANTSHEVRTPLSGILGFCNVLLENERNPRRREYLESIRTSAEHLLGVLNDILDLSKIEAGKFTLRTKPFALLPVIEDSARLFAQQAADKHIALVVDAAPDLPCSVIGDPARLKQMLTNLISNAVKFTDRGEVVISVHTEPLDGDTVELRMIVRDTGIGIRPSQKQQLFEAFQQLDGSDTREHGGTGLGLAIVKRIAELMNGHIELLESGHNGSAFELRLPVTRSDEQSPPANKLQRRVLIWEDNPRVKLALQHRFEALQITFISYDDLNELIAASSRDDILLLGFSSYADFAAHERNIPRAHIRVILLPSLTQVLSREDYLFLQKPITQQSLTDALFGSPPEQRLRAPDANQGGPAQILAVDDNASNRLLINALLDELKLPARICASGHEALALCEQQHFPLIILDLQMPELGGAQTAEKIRENALNAHSYVVALTAHLTDDHNDCAPEVFDEMLEKPLTLERLSALAKRCLSHASLKPVALGESIQRAGGRHWLALEMLERFLGELSATKRRWQEALQNQDLTALRHEAHQLSGACRYVGVPALENALERFNASSNVGQAMREGEHVVREIERLLDWSDNVELPLLFEDSENLMPRPTPSEE